jgi:hypothetical protein
MLDATHLFEERSSGFIDVERISIASFVVGWVS